MDLGSYINGKRDGREAHRIERLAMEDQLLADALEGFEAAAGDHTGAVERLGERVAARVSSGCAQRSRAAGRAGVPRVPAFGGFSAMQVRAVAASLLLCLCLGGYLTWRAQPPRPALGTLPAYPELNPWEGSRELIEQNRSRRAAADGGDFIPVGMGRWKMEN